MMVQLGLASLEKRLFSGHEMGISCFSSAFILPSTGRFECRGKTSEWKCDTTLGGSREGGRGEHN